MDTYKPRILFSAFLAILNLLNAQEMIYDEGLAPRLKSRAVKAELGNDIEAPAGSIIILDASRSRPDNGSLTYEWTFAPNFLYKDDYNYNETDNIIPYVPGESGAGERISLKKIITRNKYIELALPDAPGGTVYNVFLWIQDHVGRNDSDTLQVALTQSVEDLNTKYAIEIADATVDTVGNVEQTVEEEKPQINKLIIDETYISIQPVNRGAIKPMEGETINALLYDEIIRLGLANVMDPNRFIPDSVQALKLVERIRVDTDTLINIEKKSSRPGIDLSASNITIIDTLMQMVPLDIAAEGIDTSELSRVELDTTAMSGLMTDNTDFLYDDTISIADTLEGNQKYMKRMVTDTTIAIDSMIVYETIVTSITLDTLMYSETIDTVLYYNFNCICLSIK